MREIGWTDKNEDADYILHITPEELVRLSKDNNEDRGAGWWKQIHHKLGDLDKFMGPLEKVFVELFGEEMMAKVAYKKVLLNCHFNDSCPTGAEKLQEVQRSQYQGDDDTTDMPAMHLHDIDRPGAYGEKPWIAGLDGEEVNNAQDAPTGQ